MIEQYQFGAIVLTAIVGIYGTYFDFKENNKVTSHGWVAIVLLVCLCIVTLTLESEKHSAENLANEESKKLAEKANLQLKKTLAAVEESSATLAQTTNSLKDLQKNSQKAALALRDLLDPLKTIGFSFAVKYPSVQELFPVYGSLIEVLAARCVKPEEPFLPDYCEGVRAGTQEASRTSNGGQIDYLDDDFSYVYFDSDSLAFQSKIHILSKNFSNISIKEMKGEGVSWQRFIEGDTDITDFQYHPESRISFNNTAENLTIRAGVAGRFDLNRKMYTDLSFGEIYGEKPKSPRITTITSEYSINILYEPKTDTLIVEFNYIPLEMNQDNERLRSKFNLLEEAVGEKRLLYIQSQLDYNPNLYYVKLHYGFKGSSYSYLSGDQFIELNGRLDEGRFIDNRWLLVIDEQLREEI